MSQRTQYIVSCIFKIVQTVLGQWISLMFWPALVWKCSGYLAPEYAMGGQLTLKADVYSFGVLILEIISGRSSARTNWGGSNKFLLEWVCICNLCVHSSQCGLNDHCFCNNRPGNCMKKGDCWSLWIQTWLNSLRKR